MTTRALLTTLAIAISLSGCIRRSPAPPAPAAKPAAADSAGASASSSDSTKASSSSPRAYARVITAKAKTSEGIFKTHQIDDKLYFEIPAEMLGKDMLLVGRVARGAPSPGAMMGYGGDTFVQRTLRWDRVGNRVLLHGTEYRIRADSTLPVAQSVATATQPAVIAAFPVETFGPDSAAVIEVTRLYTTAISEFQVVRGSIDAKRSFIERVTAFPDNIAVEASQTVARSGGMAETTVAHWSMVRLPEVPMQPRLNDDRVGYFTVSHIDFGTDEHRVPTNWYIRRYRLEKKDPGAALSEPVKPIVYYVDPATPAQWVPYMKQGVEDWQKAFEAAGFKNAIIAKDAPTTEEDPDWSPDDVRNTVIRWLPSTLENAQGPSIVDPRTGEILNGSVRMFHNVMALLRDWYFVQVAHLDPRAQSLPLPDSLMGRLLRFVVAHEVGHTLGLQHNMVASAMYHPDSIRSPSWVRKMGHTPSIMDYARFNYVAQPEDGIPVADLVPDVGPYDIFAINWGYRPVPGATSPEAERPVLDSWARAQDSIPWYRFSTSGARGAEAADQAEAIGDADPVYSTRLGIRNIKRIVPLLIPATTHPTRDNSELGRLYDRLIGQWRLELSHLIAVVGGVEARELYGSQPGTRFTPLSRQRQREAVRFLNENAFRTPTFFLEPELLRRLESFGALERIGPHQAGLMTRLLDTNRMIRLIEFETLRDRKGDVYPLSEMLADLRGGIWSELSASSVRIDAFRRNLQHAHIEHLARLIADTKPKPTMVRPYLRGELVSLDAAIRAALPRAADRTTRLYLLDARETIDQALNPGK